MKEFIKGPRFRLFLAILIACSFFMAQSLPRECDCGNLGVCEFKLSNSTSSMVKVIFVREITLNKQIYEIPAGQTKNLTVIAGLWDIEGFLYKDNKIARYIHVGEYYMKPGDVKKIYLK